MKNERRSRRNFDTEFKLNIVKLIHNGASRKDVISEYDLTPSAVDKWVSQYANSESFLTVDNLTDEQKIIIEQNKKIKQLEMENDILKQAALIMGRK